MKNLLLILFVFAFGLNVNAQDYVAHVDVSEYKKEDSYRKKYTHSPSEKEFKVFFKKADEVTLKKYPESGIQKGVVYKNKLVWIVTDFGSITFDGYIFVSNKKFDKITIKKINAEMEKMNINEIAISLIKDGY